LIPVIRAIRALSLLNSSWRHIRIGRAGCDRWVFLQALLKFGDDLHCSSRGPCVANAGRRVFLLGVSDEIECLRFAKLGRWCPPIAFLIIKSELPVSRFNRFEAIGHENREAVTIDFSDLPKKKSV
jgi:hypothetical protein